MRSTGDSGAGWARLDGRSNGLNAIRLGLAVAVVVSHALILEGPGVNLLTFQMGAGAVAGFFAISGYLIAGSRARLSFLPFLWRRVLRLMPAYWVVLVVTAAVLAPIAAAVTGAAFDGASAVGYVVQNSLLVQRQPWIGDYLWNASLWTLPYEFGAYLALGVLFRLPQMRTARAGLCAVAASMLLYSAAMGGVLPWLDPNIGRLGAFFAAGATIRAARSRLPDDWRIAAIAACLAGCSFMLGREASTLLGPFPVAFVLLWLGARLRGGFTETTDLSYGMYVYAFPLQQLMVALGVGAAVGPWWFTVASVAVTAPAAAASWFAVERPAMRLRGMVGRHGSGVIPATTVHEPSSSFTFNG